MFVFEAAIHITHESRVEEVLFDRWNNSSLDNMMMWNKRKRNAQHSNYNYLRSLQEVIWKKKWLYQLIIFSSIYVQLHIFTIYFLFQCENVWQILNFTAQMVLYCTYSYESQQVINGFSTYRPQIHDILWIQLLFHSFLSSSY